MGVGTQVFVQALAAMGASTAYLAVALFISVPMTLYTLAFGVVGAALYVVVGRWARTTQTHCPASCRRLVNACPTCSSA